MFIVSDITLQINERFFEALSCLKRKRVLGGINGFCKKYGVSTGNMYTIKTRKQGAVKIDYLYILVKEYNVSAEWLLTGDGNIFKQTPARIEESPSRGT